MKRKIYKPWVAFVFLAMVFCVHVAYAADLSFQPRIQAGVMYYSFESEAISISINSDPATMAVPANYTQKAFNYSDNLPLLSIGGTLYVNRFFLDLNGQQAYDGDDRETMTYSSFGSSFSSDEVTYFGHYTAQPEHHAKFERREMAISLGYAFSSQFSLFFGYKQAKTEFSTTFRGPMDSIYDHVNPDMDMSSGAMIRGKDEYSFEYEGPFVGAVYGWDFSQVRFLKGTLTAKLALASLEGEVELHRRQGYMKIVRINDQPVPNPIEISTGNAGMANRYDTKGSTLGLSIGMGWRGLTAYKGLSYSIGLSGYRYEFDAHKDDQSDINETALAFKVGFSYAF